MKHIVLVFLATILTTTTMVLAQDYVKADATIEFYPETFEDITQFDSFLSRDFTNDEEKVRAIYSWLIKNVSYDPDAYKLFNYYFKNYRDRNQKEEKSRKKIIEYTLRTGKAVCEGYAMTFEKLLTLQGIDNYLIQGDTKTHFKDIDRDFNLNHMWNAIKIDGTWHLFDATWGAGKYTDRFIKEPSYFYFKIAPSALIKTHYPQDISDAFVEESPSFKRFSQQPIYIDPRLELEPIATSKVGVIDKQQSANELAFGLLTQIKNASYAYDGKIFPVKTVEETENGIHFTIPLQRNAETLLIYLDDKPVLAYKLK